MKKTYMEPQMIVEDFTVSEMIAADCVLPERELLIVEQMSHKGCDDGTEPKYWVDGKVWGQHNGKGTAYAYFSDIFGGSKDVTGDGVNDFVFTTSYQGPGVCEYDPIAKGQTFGYGYTCNDDVSALQKS